MQATLSLLSHPVRPDQLLMQPNGLTLFRFTRQQATENVYRPGLMNRKT